MSEKCVITDNEFFTSLWRYFRPVFLAELLSLGNNGGFLSMNSLLKVMTEFTSGVTRPLQNLHFFFLSHSKVDLPN